MSISIQRILTYIYTDSIQPPLVHYYISDHVCVNGCMFSVRAYLCSFVDFHYNYLLRLVN